MKSLLAPLSCVIWGKPLPSLTTPPSTSKIARLCGGLCGMLVSPQRSQLVPPASSSRPSVLCHGPEQAPCHLGSWQSSWRRQVCCFLKCVSTRTAGRPSAGLAGIRKRHPLWTDQLGEDTPPGAVSAHGYTQAIEGAWHRPLLVALEFPMHFTPKLHPSTRRPWAGHNLTTVHCSLSSDLWAL